MSKIVERAEQLGVFAAYYNAGGRPRWKVANVDKDYFALSGSETLATFTDGRDVMIFLDGYEKGKASR